jgi:hypothetical protein
MNDDEFGLEPWQVVFVRSWNAGNQIMGTVSRSPWHITEEETEDE